MPVDIPPGLVGLTTLTPELESFLRQLSDQLPPELQAFLTQSSIDVTAFPTGSASFGGGSGGAGDDINCPLRQTVQTDWPVASQLLVRQVVTIPAGASAVRVMVSVDNDIVGVFFNGRRLTEHTQGTDIVAHGFCPIPDEFRFDVPPEVVQPGRNLVAFHVVDRGLESFFDARILAERPAPSEQGRNWDLVPNREPGAPGTFDANGFFLNPRWRWQRAGSMIPNFDPRDRTQPITPDFPPAPAFVVAGTCTRPPHVFQPTRGHFNWFDNRFDVTIEGPVVWRDHSTSTPFGDDDYNVNIVTDPVPNAPAFQGQALGAGVTPGTEPILGRDTVPMALRGRRAIKGEFKARETIDHFDSIPWWRRFHTLVDVGADLPGLEIDGHPAIITGLMGLDDEHNDASEIHPVHVFAVQIHEQRNPADDAWAIFVRNWGNEGYCSSHFHFLNRETISVRLRRPDGLPTTTRAVCLPSTVFAGENLATASKEVEIRSQAGTDATVVLHLPLPNKECMGLGGGGASIFVPKCGLIAGELHLAWRNAPPDTTHCAFVQALRSDPEQAVTSNPEQAVRESDEEEDTEARLKAIFDTMTDEQRADAQAIADILLPPPTPGTVEELVPVLLDAPPPQAPLDMPPRSISSAPAIRQVMEDMVGVRAICFAAPDVVQSAGIDCSAFSAKTADLIVTTTGSPGAVTVGAKLTYTFTITNNGPDDATGLTLSDILPAEVTLVSAPEGCSGTEGTVTCNLGSLANGHSTTVQLVATATEVGDITNAAIVASGEIDPDLTNNATTEDTTINPTEVVTNRVSFEPIDSTSRTTADASGCPSDFSGKSSFEARLTNTSTDSLSSLVLEVKTLTNGNLLQNANGGPGGVGARLTVPKVRAFEVGDYADGVLSPGEFVDVPIIICLKEEEPFDFVVDVLGVVGEGGE